jgi:hypothetical protein
MNEAMMEGTLAYLRKINEQVDATLLETLKLLGTDIRDSALTVEYESLMTVVRWHGIPILEAVYGAESTIRYPSPESALRIKDAVAQVRELIRPVEVSHDY